MPGVYAEGEIELVGFGVGVAERDRLIDGSSVSQGDAMIGLASSGCHSNGYSLVRRIVDDAVRARPRRAARGGARAQHLARPARC